VKNIFYKNADIEIIRRMLSFCFVFLVLDRGSHFAHRSLKPSLLCTDKLRQFVK